MPRTKIRNKSKDTKLDSYTRNFNRLMQLKIRGLETDYQMMEQKFDLMMETTMARYPAEIQNMTLGELLKPESPKATFQTPSRSQGKVLKSSKTIKSMASDEGYQSKDSTVKKSDLKVIKKRSRSSSRDRKSKLADILQSSRKPKKELKTPDSKPTKTFTITPKVQPNTAINVLRKPRDGEMVFSTSGSPLLVATTVSNRMANVNVPLRNGNVVSFLPFNEHALTDELHLDDETRKQLQILRSHLSKVLD